MGNNIANSNEVIPRKENYKIVFVGLSDPIYKIKLDGKIIDKYSLDLETNNGTKYENVALANEDQKAEFLCGILYHKYRTNYEDFNKKFNIEIGSRSLSDMLKGKKITEELGVYYQNDSDIPDVNKTQKRIITYTITN